MTSQNIQSIEIPLSSAPGRVYFPTDTPLTGLFINSIEFFYSYGDADESRMTQQGHRMIDIIDVAKCLVSLTTNKGKEIVKNGAMSSIANDSAFRIAINSKLDFSKSFITVTNQIYANQSIFCLVHYSIQDNKPVDGKINVGQIIVPVSEGRTIIGAQPKFAGKKIVRIEAVNGDYNSFISLLCKDLRRLENIPTQRLFQIPNAQNLWVEPVSSIDWERSYIDVVHNDEHENPDTITLNIYYL